MGRVAVATLPAGSWQHKKLNIWLEAGQINNSRTTSCHQKLPPEVATSWKQVVKTRPTVIVGWVKQVEDGAQRGGGAEWRDNDWCNMMWQWLELQKCSGNSWSRSWRRCSRSTVTTCLACSDWQTTLLPHSQTDRAGGGEREWEGLL